MAKRKGANTKQARPALLAVYQDMTAIRHDYPLLLAAGGVRTLTSVVNGALRLIAPKGADGERLRRAGLAAEREVRRFVDQGNAGCLSELWTKACGATELTQEAESVGRALGCDGPVIGCDQDAPEAAIGHIWRTLTAQRDGDAVEALTALTLKVEGVLQSDLLKSDEGRSADALRESSGLQDNGIDFGVMSETLRAALPVETMPEARRERVTAALGALHAQTVFGAAPEARCFTSCSEALAEARATLPELADFVKATRIAQLELDNHYDEATHDALFEAFDETTLSANEIRLLPSRLVSQPADAFDAADKAALLDILSTGLPIKVIVTVSDVMSETTGNRLSAQDWSGQIATMAATTNAAHVVQTTSAQLGAVSPTIAEGLDSDGPSLVSVLAPAIESDVDSYLVSAAAVDARAFPVFVHNPDAGDDQATRFTLDGNPQLDAAWPAHSLQYEDDALQSITEEVAFTFIDFLAMDARFADAFTRVTREDWNDAMTPVADVLAMDAREAHGRTPYVWLVDEENTLFRATIDERLIPVARQCADTWQALQEMGGVNNSHAIALLEQEKAAWEEAKAAEIAELVGQSPEVTDTPAMDAVEEAATVVEEVEARPPGEPYIETTRCNSCNECTNKNKAMFEYNENKQATIKDVTAGTFRDLVEAAEKCQMAIIHPGKPLNPDEADLEDLIKRAAPFI